MHNPNTNHNVFDAHANDWWNEKGAFHPLHALNPKRVDFLLKHLRARGVLQPNPLQSLQGLKILDVGCGGGILCEPLARLGAAVTGIDVSTPAIDVASSHAAEQGLEICYEVRDLHNMPAHGFDVIIASEVIEHVVDPAAFVQAIGSALKPGGCSMITTLNRTWKSYALGIFVAENILRWAPKGAHQHGMFIKPSELLGHVEQAGMRISALCGLVFSPLTWSWSLDESVQPDLSINYFAFCEKPL